ncbi:MAG: ABC transporter ATP-binding protein [Proteobacteria bacterium]|nr:ABC transporter ATP-binding protein [Pseudomonadota bacterium]
MLHVHNVCKTLRGRRVLDDVSLVCEEGAITVLTGANGAGKSTLLKIIAGVMEPDRGALTIAGSDRAHAPGRARQALGYVPERANPPGHMTGEELLYLVRALKGAPPLADDIRAQLGIDAIANQRIERLSLGERRRVCLAAAMVGAPRLLVLDEPTNGLDVGGIAVLGELLRECKTRSAAVLLATHDVPFADSLADARLHLDRGQLVVPAQ